MDFSDVYPLYSLLFFHIESLDFLLPFVHHFFFTFLAHVFALPDRALLFLFVYFFVHMNFKDVSEGLFCSD